MNKVMYCKALRYHSVIKRAEKDLYFEFNVSKVELELLTSLGMLILETGKIYHGREKIFRRALKPFKNRQFYAAMFAIVRKDLVIIRTQRKDKIESLTLSLEGLTILERFDMRINELFEASAEKDKQDKTIHEIIKGTYN